MVDHIRADYPNEFVQVNVDASNFGLRVSRKSNEGWQRYDSIIPLPEEAYNVNARTVPDNLVLPTLPTRKPRMASSSKSPPRGQLRPGPHHGEPGEGKGVVDSMGHFLRGEGSSPGAPSPPECILLTPPNPNFLEPHIEYIEYVIISSTNVIKTLPLYLKDITLFYSSCRPPAG